MDSNKDNKRRKDKHEDDDHQKDKRYKRARTRSRSPPRMSERDSRRKRRHSRSRSRDRPMKQERTGNDPPKDIQSKKEVPERKTKETDMLNTRTGGAYIPPARLRMMQAQITDKSSIAYQRLAWEALKKSIHGHINKINVGNIGIIIKELLKENIVRGRGLLCRSVIQAQAASPTFTNVYAALVSAVNSRFPNIGELLLKRLVIQFKRGFKRNDKPICISSALFIAHLVNQRVAHEILALELLTLLVESPTDDSVEVAIAFLKECGQKLTEVSSKGVNAIFEMLRNILHEGQLDKRVQYMIEVMFQVWKDGFKDHPALIEELELVPEEEQFTHLLMLDDATDSQDILNVFKFDEKYEENEQKYKTLSKEILGSDAESEEEDGSGESGSEESEEEEEEAGEQKPVTIIDNTETNLVALRRTIYLTINSSLDFEECAHKLMKMQLKPGQEVELCHMFLDCCAEQRTYEKFYGLLAQRFCNINRMYISPFEEIFKDSYGTAHRLDTNRLRNVSKFFAHLLFTDSISWEVLECVKLNEEDTTSSSRIYIKILFQELAEYMGLKKLNDRLKDPTLQIAFAGIFPRDNPKNTRFSINFFTSIGLGGLTDELREHLKQMPKNVPPPVPEIKLDSDSESSSSSSSSSSEDSSSDSSSSDSENERMKKKKKTKKDKTPKTPEEPEKPEKDKNVERWGHDGFYDTYGKDARRNERKPDHYERDKDNFIRPRDINRRNDDRNRQRERYESKNDEDRRRREDRTGRDNDDKEDSRRNNREDKRRDRDQDRQYNEDRNKNRDEESRSRRELERNNDDRWRREDRSTRDENDEPRRNFREDRDDRRRNWDQDRTYSNGKNKEKNDADYRSRREPERNNQNYDDRRRRDYKDGREGNEDVRRDGRDEKQDKRRERERNDERKERVDDDTRRKREIGRIDKDSKNVEYRKEEVERKNRTDKDDKRRNKNDVSDDERSGNRHERQRKESPDRTKTRNDDKKKDVEDNLDNDIQNNKKREKGGRICSKSAEEADNHDSEEKRSKKNSKNKKKKKYRSESSDESSDEDRRREEYEHDDESKCKKRDKKKRGEDKKKVKEDMSDVKRENSIHRELGGRYWETG